MAEADDIKRIFDDMSNKLDWNAMLHQIAMEFWVYARMSRSATNLAKSLDHMESQNDLQTIDQGRILSSLLASSLGLHLSAA